MKTIDKAFEDAQRGDIVEVNLSTRTAYLDLTPGMAYQISRDHVGIHFPKAEVVAKENKIGYNINRVFYKPSGEVNYHFIGFSFTKDNAKRKAHDYALKMAKEVSEKHGLELVDESQEEIAFHKKALDDDYEKFQKEQAQEAITHESGHTSGLNGNPQRTQ